MYYLWDGDTVIYIGSSRNVEKRVRTHLYNLNFAGYFCDECEPHELLENEARAIEEFQPQFNIIGTRQNKPKRRRRKPA